MDHEAQEECGASFVVPAFNERLLIDRVVAACHETGRELINAGEACSYEIVIVDDASTDGTGELCDAIAASDPLVTVVHHATNRTLGASLRSGFATARGRHLVYTDADLPFDLGELLKAFRLLRYYDADVVSAYRFSRAGEGATRLVYSHGYNMLIRMLFGLRVRDVNFAAKIVKKEVLEKLDLRSEGSFIDAELLIRAERAGFKIIQFGVDYFPRSHGQSKLSSPRVIGQMVTEMRRLAPEMRQGR